MKNMKLSKEMSTYKKVKYSKQRSYITLKLNKALVEAKFTEFQNLERFDFKLYTKHNLKINPMIHLEIIIF